MTDFATGGVIDGPRDPGDDRVPAFLSPGYVIIDPVVREHYNHLLDRLNEVRPPLVTSEDEKLDSCRTTGCAGCWTCWGEYRTEDSG